MIILLFKISEEQQAENIFIFQSTRKQKKQLNRGNLWEFQIFREQERETRNNWFICTFDQNISWFKIRLHVGVLD